MHWFVWFGQIVAGVLGVISVLWMIGGGFMAVLQLLKEREEYRIECEQLDYRQ
jgi:hypothetical protein